EVRFLEDTYKSEIELFQIRNNYLTFYAGCDWSSGKHALFGDYSAIIVLAKDSETNVIYVVCADIARRRTSKILDDIISYCKVWPIRKFAIETNQAQDILADLLQEGLRKEDLSTEVVRIVQAGDKKERIHNLQPLINTARLVFSKRHHLLLEQLKYFPRGRHEDGLDALEMAVRLAGCKKAFNPDEYIKLLQACKGNLPSKNPNDFFIQGGQFIPNPFRLLKAK
ncbi:MAG: phage terminase large subunit, partial [Candidatus Omnitrophica bacterium]|nr:phage terminase large subunit [Candidatus Omnitrophota bacterium]